jgi:hypothetical protein
VKKVLAIASLISLALGVALTQVGCSKSDQDSAKTNPALSTPVPAGMVRGPVLETMDAAGYTYVQIDTGTEKRWLAAPKSEVKAGDVVQAKEGMAMPGFESKALNRTFEVVFFVPGLENLSNPATVASTAAADSKPAAADMSKGHPPMGAAPAEVVEDVKVAPVTEGKDIAELYANKDSYKGDEITIRGKVVKYNPNILGWNFLHIRDGSGDASTGTNDITVTTKDVTQVGATVVVKGKVSLNTDFGYAYPVLIEDAKLTAE